MKRYTRKTQVTRRKNNRKKPLEGAARKDAPERHRVPEKGIVVKGPLEGVVRKNIPEEGVIMKKTDRGNSTKRYT
jgi:hypothetical protein